MILECCRSSADTSPPDGQGYQSLFYIQGGHIHPLIRVLSYALYTEVTRYTFRVSSYRNTFPEWIPPILLRSEPGSGQARPQSIPAWLSAGAVLRLRKASQPRKASDRGNGRGAGSWGPPSPNEAWRMTDPGRTAVPEAGFLLPDRNSAGGRRNPVPSGNPRSVSSGSGKGRGTYGHPVSERAEACLFTPVFKVKSFYHKWKRQGNNGAYTCKIR